MIKKEKIVYDYSTMSFADKVKHLGMIIPRKYRVGSGIGKYKETAQKKKVYDNYLIIHYIDARDCQDRLDEIFGPYRKRDHHDVAGKSYSTVSLYDPETNQWISRSDVGAKTAIASEKGEASDGFKRANVNRGLGRFLYTMPVFYATSDEIKNNKDLTEYIKTKYKEDLTLWVGSSNEKVLEGVSKYQPTEEDVTEEIDIKNDIIKKDYTERHFSLLQGQMKGKTRDEVMKKVLEQKKEYNISDEYNVKINTFLSSINPDDVKNGNN